jgi:dihydroneopterin aldolase
MKFYAFHGFYAEEQKTGTWFSVDVEVEVSSLINSDQESLEDTINYETIHQIAKDAMVEPKQLIETVCGEIYSNIRSLRTPAPNARVQVFKLHPPLNGVGSSSYEISDFT